MLVSHLRLVCFGFPLATYISLPNAMFRHIHTDCVSQTRLVKFRIEARSADLIGGCNMDPGSHRGHTLGR